jgi:predicted permease
VNWLGRFFRKSKLESQLDSELRFHVEQQTVENIAAGMNPDEAHRSALAQFGGLEYIKEETRDARGIHFLETVFQDFRFALRMLRKSPGFTAVAVLTLALGIGANTAIFSIIDAALLNALPYPDAGRLVILNESLPKMAGDMVSWPDFLDWRAQSRAFDAMAAYQLTSSTLLRAGNAVKIPVQFVSPSYFSILGVRPYLGRLLNQTDNKAAGVNAVVVTYSLWQNKLKGDPAIIGKTVDLDGYPTPVVGVLPPNFRDFAGDAQLYGPIGWMSAVPAFAARDNHPGILVLARLRSGVSLATAQSVMDTIMARLGELYPKSDRGERANIWPIFTFYFASAENLLLPLLAAVGLVLLLACANVANLFLARTGLRHRELGVRAALGASRSRLICQLLSESLVVSALGATVGLALAFGGGKLLIGLEPGLVPISHTAILNPAVLGFTLFAAVLTTILFGLAPSWQATRFDVSRSLGEYSQHTSASVSQRRLRSALLGCETAIGLVVVVSALLVIRSLAATLAVNPGFDADHVLTLSIEIPSREVSTAHDLNFVSRALDRITHLPGVRFAGAAMNPPLHGLQWTSPYLLEGEPAPEPTEWPNTALNMITPDYFRAIGTPLLAGRFFTDSDSDDSVAVAIVNETMARRIAPDGNAVGKQLRVRYAAHPLVQVVGVVPDIKQYSLTANDWPEVYVPFAQMPVSFMTFMIRAAGDPSSLGHAAISVLQRIDPDLPVSHVVPFSAYISDSVRRERFMASLLGAFGLLALVLAAVGAYGVVNCSVSQRIHELGIRAALGARPRDLLWLTLREGMFAAGVGILFGLAGALASTRLLQRMLFKVRPTDSGTFAAVSVLLVIVTLLACYIPARRAMRVDPMVALRHE